MLYSVLITQKTISLTNPEKIQANSELYLDYTSDYFDDDERIITPPIDSIGAIGAPLTEDICH